MTQVTEPRPLAPLNPFVRTLLLETVDSSTGTIAPVATGAVTGFLATSSAPDATAAAPSLSVSGVYVGGQSDGRGGTYEAGTWLFAIDGSVLTTTLLDPLFAAATPYFIVSRSGAIRKFEQLQYVRSDPATIA